MTLRRMLLLFTALALCLCVPALAEIERTVTVAESWGFPMGFYPVMTPEAVGDYGVTYWSRNFFETLVRYDESGEIVPELATSWTVSEDGLTYTFALREGVKFSDGTDMKSAQVKTSMEAAIQNLGAYNGSYGHLTTIIASVEAPDDYTLVLNLATPYYAALNDLTMCNPLGVVGAAAFNDDLTTTELIVARPLGTGPYMLESGDGAAYTFVRNPFYWGAATGADEFVIKVIADNDAKVLALRAGEIDAIIGSMRLNYDAYAELSRTAGYGGAVNGGVTKTRYLGFNLSLAPFDDVRVRQAVCHALDNETLAAMIFQGIETAASAIISPDRLYCDVTVETYAYDVEKAKALLEEAGWTDADGDGVREKDGATLAMALKYMTEAGSVDDAALAVAAQLNAVGFKVTPAASDMMTWYGALLQGDYQITLYCTYGGAFDPSTIMTNINPAVSTDPVLLQAASVLPEGSALIEELDATASAERAAEIYAEVLKTITAEAVFAPVTNVREFGVWNASAVAGYAFPWDAQYVEIANFNLK